MTENTLARRVPKLEAGIGRKETHRVGSADQSSERSLARLAHAAGHGHAAPEPDANVREHGPRRAGGGKRDPRRRAGFAAAAPRRRDVVPPVDAGRGRRPPPPPTHPARRDEAQRRRARTRGTRPNELAPPGPAILLRRAGRAISAAHAAGWPSRPRPRRRPELCVHSARRAPDGRASPDHPPATPFRGERTAENPTRPTARGPSRPRRSRRP